MNIRPMNTWHLRLVDKMTEKGWSAVDMATRTGIQATLIRKYKAGEVDSPRGDTIPKLADALKVSEIWLRHGVEQGLLEGVRPNRAPTLPQQEQEIDPKQWPKDIPVAGTAAGSSEGSFQFTDSTIEHLRRPPTLMGKAVYALYIENDSMAPRYFPGEVVFVDQNRPPRPGDYVIVQTKASETEDARALCKRLVRRTERALILQQHNPESEIEIDTSHVLCIHRVIPWEEVHSF